MQEEKNSKYSIEYIRKYLNGELSGPEMQALEKAALEDPFLADAMEGFEESRKHAVSFESGIADLNTKLSHRIHERKRKNGILIQLSKWPVAASLLLIIGLAVLMVTLVNKKQNISQTAPHTDSSAVTLKQVPQKNAKNDDSLKAVEPVIAAAPPPDAKKNPAVRKEKNTVAKADESVPKKIQGNSSLTEPTASSADSSRESEKFEMLAKKDIDAPMTATTKKNLPEERSSGIAASPSAAPSGNYIKGMVINDKGKPVAFAEVNVKGTNKHVFTDSSGFFKLYMKDPRLAALVYLQPAGYESASAELIPDSNVTNRIQLHSSSATESDSDTLTGDKISAFVMGWDAFYHFIDSNKKINTKDSLMKGEEMISFTLYADGRLSPCRVEESVSPAHDKEIIRLIPLAPALTLRDRKSFRCVLRIQFK